jgi:hypothetical protein
MQNAQEIYTNIRTLPSAELLRLAALILDDLARTMDKLNAPESLSNVNKKLSDKQAKTAARRARDIEIINANADRLNEEAMDALSYQVEI